MDERHRRLGSALGVALALATATAGCKKPVPQQNEKPPDHLGPEEVVESKENAFGLPLPRVATVKARFPTTVHVVSPLTAEELSNFVRKRVTGGTVTPGATSTVLEGATPRDDAQKRLHIEVRGLRDPNGMRSEMVVRDATPAPLVPGLSDEERWKRAGLKPGGEVLDPKTLGKNR